MNSARPSVLALIPARAGSVRLPHKNTRLLAGTPLVARAVAAAKKSHVDRVVVSTDSEEVRKIALEAGAEVPYLRPPELATDTSPIIDTVLHVLHFYSEKEHWEPDIVVLVQPTSPFVADKDINDCIEMLERSKTNSCVSVTLVRERPEWMFELRENGRLEQRDSSDIFARSQDMPPLYRLNGAVYASRRSVVVDKKMLFDPKDVAAIVMPIERSIDIDTIDDWNEAEQYADRH